MLRSKTATTAPAALVRSYTAICLKCELHDHFGSNPVAYDDLLRIPIANLSLVALAHDTTGRRGWPAGQAPGPGAKALTSRPSRFVDAGELFVLG